MRDFVRDNFGVKGEDVLVLRGEVHGSDADAVHILVLENCAPMSQTGQILVEDRHRQEVSPSRALERSAHFHHPVRHLGPVLFRDLVASDWVGHRFIILHAGWMLSVQSKDVVKNFPLLLTTMQVLHEGMQVVA